MAPFMPFSPGVSTTSAPNALSSRRRSRLMVSGMVTIELVAAGGAGEGQADAGVAAGRLDDGGVLVDLAVALGGVDHGHADAVLDRPERVEVLQLGDHGRLGVADHAAQADQRRVADGLGDVVVNPAAKGLGHGEVLDVGKPGNP